jgi:hypothetical protein
MANELILLGFQKRHTFFCSTGVSTQGLHLESLHQSFFVIGIFEIGSLELFARVGFEPQSF